MSVDLKDVMSPELLEHLRTYRRYALTTLRGLRRGGIDKQEAAMRLVRVYNLYFAWEIEDCRYGVAHPCYVFASRLLRAAKILMGEKWVNYHLET